MLLKQFYRDPQPIPSPLSTCKDSYGVDLDWSGNYIHHYVFSRYSAQLAEDFLEKALALSRVLEDNCPADLYNSA